ncbi:DUF11 domain-containing protein [filamentous cyanobacterium LEGE 11480]|uniref:DUF11 domain-containing protein n=1 Tax=Romeriopsis navalis LEGE 11480 TaxID=2777977 RepID=A0A928VMU0_9CYAN|nr:hypothetical protein [Romeriopsis navalis]MBE9028859.1 DUF11 domain-containing protein [Romeriopsis navalis LEGE 11480]
MCIKPYSKLRWRYRTAITLTTLSLLNPVAALAQATPPTPTSAGDTAVARTPLVNQAAYEYAEPNSQLQFRTNTSQLTTQPTPLVDPLGRILGCNGAVLPDYTGFSVALYEVNPADPTGTELGNLVTLTTTEVPDIQDNGIPGGLTPNRLNLNPFPLSNAVPENERGVYNFLFDPSRGQIDAGSQYILVITPPSGSVFQQRRIRLEIVESIGSVGNSVVRYIATSLDGQPVEITGATEFQDTIAFVSNAETIGLDLLALEFTARMCQPNQVQIIKSADRALSEPGETAIYRLSIRNRADAPLTGVDVSDILPQGFKFLPNSVRGEIDNQIVPITATVNGNTVQFTTDANIPADRVLNVAYATQLNSDSIRGTGRNSAVVTARREDNGLNVKDGPATHQMRISPGLLADCGVIIGRVFDDRNFDGEKQPDEPGIPNAVVFLDDGNRITTDAKGMYSVSNVLSGSRTGVLDLTSIPGYTLAPNEKVKARRSQSRLVRLAPGGLVRMNFAVTPTSKSAGQL